MKYRVWFALAGFSACVFAEVSAAPAEPQVVERGPHHRVIEHVVTEQRPDGSTAERVARYTELASGMHFKNELGQWLESKEEIEIFQGAAVARQGPHRVVFASNLNSPGAIDLLTPDQKRFRSHILGLAYTDAASGRSVMIAEMQDSIGAVLPPNQILYSSALHGDCLADVRFTYTKAAFEQDIILMTAPPSPAEWNMNPETTRLEVFTEFIEIPEGTMTPVVLKQENDPVARQQRVEPDLIDQRLDFGVMKFEQGYAFPLEASNPFGEQSVLTGKSIERIDGRVFLIEKVDYTDIHAHLQQLPQQAAAANPPRKAIEPANGRRQFAGLLPPALKGERGAWKEKQFAKVEPNRVKGLVIDYTTLNGSLTNLTLRSDTVYYLNTNNTVNLYGTTVIESTCVKFGPGTTRLQILGTTDCRTDPYRPAFFVSKDDDTVGTVLPNSTGSPGTNRYALAAVHLATSGTSHSLAHLRFRNAVRALWVTTGTATFTLEHSQFGFTDYPIYSQNTGLSPVRGRNLLVHDALNAFRGDSNSSNWLEHLTVHRVKTFNAGGAIFLTNSLVISTTNALTFTGSPNVANLDDTGFFQTVGTGARYLANGSTNRNTATTNINPDLLAALRKKTTYPPIVIGDGTWFTNSLTLHPQAQRDTDTPDLGYHYDCLDYVFSGLALTNATITAMPGVAIGTRTLGSYGLALMGGASFYCEGTPENLNRIVRYNTVQEQANTNWTEYSSGGASLLTAWTPASPAPHARIRFAEFSVPGGTAIYHLWGQQEDGGTHDLRDCQFHGGILLSERPTLGVTNCLFNRTRIELVENYDMNPTFRHCTFVGSDLTLAHAGSGTWTFQNNLFDATTNSYVEGSFTNNYNAYTTNATRLTPNGANDVRLSVTNIAYDTGWLGRFYLPTNLTSHSTLFDAGSAAAHTLGFYHFTVVTNQTRELTGVIDFGFHSVAVDASGQPLDSDGDGLPDYFEDKDGDGTSDASETNWQDYNSFNGLTGSPGLQVFTPLK